MEQLMVFVGIAGFLLRISHKLVGLLFLWWRKEYRFDRMRIHLETPQGRQMLFGKTQLGFYALILLWVISPSLLVAEAALALYAFTLGVLYIRNIRGWHLPPVSPKVLALSAGCMLVLVGAVAVSPLPVLITLAIADALLFPVTAAFVFLLSVPTSVYHRLVIGRAVAVLRNNPPKRVVGITGSYGKTSVKEYLSAILSGTYKTLKTEASKNSPIGIAETVLRDKGGYDTFVVEMGAYKRGEIAYMSGMVLPEVGILTAINPQHQDLFGSIETTMRAKYELFERLTGRRIAIVNLDDERTRVMGEWAHRDGCQVWGYTMNGNARADFVSVVFSAERVKADRNGVSFDCVSRGQKAHVHAPVLGRHQAGNILAAIAGAVACGVGLAEAAKRAQLLRPAHKVMEIVKSDGPVYIDDTFNNNPDAAKAAIAFLGTLSGKKYLVFQPMVELGSYAESSHEDVGKFAADHIDAVLLTNDSHKEAFQRGAHAVSEAFPVLTFSPSAAAAYVRKHVKKEDSVLFKGKDAEHVLNILLGRT